MSSSDKSSSSTNIIFDIPPELIKSGKTLLIEEYFELFVDGRHLSKPAHFVRRTHGLCLIDTQQQDLRTVDHDHHFQSDIDDNQLVQVIIEFSAECLNVGKSITIEKIDSNGKDEPIGNFEDLYHVQGSKDIHIKIPKESIQRGKTIVIQKGKILVAKSDDYQKEQSHHLSNNQFSKRDHLQSTNLMQLTIEIPPEILNNGQTIAFREEDPQMAAANFPYHRQSKPEIKV